MLTLRSAPIRRAGLDQGPEARTVADVMTLDVAIVSPETVLHEAARLLLGQWLPALPVVDSKGGVVGVLSEHDLTRRLAPRRARPWWHLFVDAEQLAREYRKATGTTVGEVMTHPAVTLGPTAPLAEAARLFEAPELDVVSVVRAERLVGAVARRHLLAKLSTGPAEPIRRADAELVAEMQERMAQEVWISKPGPTAYSRDGILALWGIVGGDAERAALITMARSIPGCEGVEDRLLVRGATYRYHEMV